MAEKGEEKTDSVEAIQQTESVPEGLDDTEVWKDQVDEGADDVFSAVENLVEGEQFSINILIDQPWYGGQAVVDLSFAKKRSLVRLVREWLPLNPGMKIEYVLNRGGQEITTSEKTRIHAAELVDIRFSPAPATPAPEKKEKKLMTKSVELKGGCGHCGHITKLRGTVNYLSGEDRGQATIDEKTYKAGYDRRLGWSVEVDCVCTTDIDKEHPGKHSKIFVHSKIG